MSGSPTWNSWFSFPFFAPLSGAVNQDIDTGPYQGVPEIEIAIIREVGSFGKQLGIIGRGRISGDKAEVVEMIGLYWHFVDVVWVVIFTLVYLIPA